MKGSRKLIQVRFTEDFATKKAGDICFYEPSLACNLVKRKLAVIEQSKTLVETQAIKKTKK